MKKTILSLLISLLLVSPALAEYWQTIIDAKNADGSFVYKIDKTSIKATTIGSQKIIYYTVSLDVTNNDGSLKAINSYKSNCQTYESTLIKTKYNAKGKKNNSAKGSQKVNKPVTGKDLQDLKGTIDAICSNKL